jgi:hypothetical protein
MQALYSNLQLDLSRGLFPFALPSKILQNLTTFPAFYTSPQSNISWHLLSCGASNRFLVLASGGFAITHIGHIKIGRTPLGEWSARRRDLNLRAHNCYKKNTSLPPEGFEPTFPVSERPQTHTLDRAVTKIGPSLYYHTFCNSFLSRIWK